MRRVFLSRLSYTLLAIVTVCLSPSPVLAATSSAVSSAASPPANMRSVAGYYLACIVGAGVPAGLALVLPTSYSSLIGWLLRQSTYGNQLLVSYGQKILHACNQFLHAQGPAELLPLPWTYRRLATG